MAGIAPVAPPSTRRDQSTVMRQITHVSCERHRPMGEGLRCVRESLERESLRVDDDVNTWYTAALYCDPPRRGLCGVEKGSLI